MSWLVLRRCAALLSALMWSASLLPPAYATLIEAFPDGHAMDTVVEPGWSLLLIGWAGPLEQFDPVFAWYANPALIWCAWRLANQKELSQKAVFAGAAVVTIGSALAWSGLQPTHIEYGDDHGVNGKSYPLIGAYIWSASFIPVLVAMWIEWLRRISLDGAIAPSPAGTSLKSPGISLEERGRTNKQDAVGVALVVMVLATLITLAMFLWKASG